MPTCRDVITLALQLARIVPLGKDPKAKESEAGLSILQGMYDSFFADGLFATLEDYYADADYDALENQRIVADEATITIPDTYEDGTRAPRDLSALVIITDTSELHYVFSNGGWVACHGLTLDSEAPLANRGLDGLAALLAMYFAEAFGGSLGPRFTQRALMFKNSLMFKYGSTRDATASSYY